MDEKPPWHTIYWIKDPCYNKARELRFQLILQQRKYLEPREYDRLTDYYGAAMSTLRSQLRDIKEDTVNFEGDVTADYARKEQALVALQNELSAIQIDQHNLINTSDEMEHTDSTESPTQIQQLVSTNPMYSGLPQLLKPKENASVGQKISKPFDQTTENCSDSDSENENYKTQRSKRARRSSNSSPINQNNYAIQTNFETNNRFNNLREINLSGNTGTNSKDKSKIPTPKVRPITIKTPKTKEELKNLCEKIEIKGHCSFTIKSSTTFTKFFATTPECYKEIVAIIDQENIQHYLFPERTTVPLKVVMRGLPRDSDISEIETDLKDLNFNILKIAQMESFKTKEKMPLFQIQLENSPQSKEIFNLKRFHYRDIRIENYNRPSRTIQCYNCQYFHHSSQNCKMLPRCVKCAQNHLTKECPNGTGQIDKEKIKCCNCGSIDHVASYRNCPKFPGNKSKKDSNFVKTGFSYANVVNTNSPPPPVNPQQPTPSNSSFPSLNNNELNLSSLTNILEEIANQFGCNSFQDLITKYQNCLKKLQQTTDPATKLSIFLETLEQSPHSAP